jgi:UDP-glucose 4-epimerase
MQDPLEDSNLNVTSSLKLFLACREADISNVVYLNSGGAIYGEMMNAPFKESDTVKPISPYAISKYSSELYGFALFADTNMSFVSRALGNVYGSVRENQKGIFHEIWQAHINNRNFKIFGSDCIRDYIYVNDVVSSIILALNFKGIERFNISSSFGTENQELVHKFSALTKKPLQVEVFPKRAGDLKSSVMSNIKAKDQLGWQPLISLDEGMKIIFDF